jgi:hypothetical protein
MTGLCFLADFVCKPSLVPQPERKQEKQQARIWICISARTGLARSAWSSQPRLPMSHFCILWQS